MSASIQTEHLKSFVEWLETCEYKYTISSMQGGAVHVKFFMDEASPDHSQYIANWLEVQSRRAG